MAKLPQLKVVGEQFLIEIVLKVFNSVKLKTIFYAQTTYNSSQNNPLLKIILVKYGQKKTLFQIMF